MKILIIFSYKNATNMPCFDLGGKVLEFSNLSAIASLKFLTVIMSVIKAISVNKTTYITKIKTQTMVLAAIRTSNTRTLTTIMTMTMTKNIPRDQDYE